MQGARRCRKASNTPVPFVLGEATTEMLLASEETFGPVAPLFRFETEEEAIAIANGTPFGLAAYFYTENSNDRGVSPRRWSSAWSGSTPA